MIGAFHWITLKDIDSTRCSSGWRRVEPHSPNLNFATTPKTTEECTHQQISKKVKLFCMYRSSNFWLSTWRCSLQLVLLWQPETSGRDYYHQSIRSLQLWLWRRKENPNLTLISSLISCLRDSQISQFFTQRRKESGWLVHHFNNRFQIKLKTFNLTTKWFAKKSPNISSSHFKSIVSTVWWSHQESLVFRSMGIRLMLSLHMLICWTTDAPDKHHGNTATNVKASLSSHLKTSNVAIKFMTRMVKSATLDFYLTMVSSIWITMVTSSHSRLRWTRRILSIKPSMNYWVPLFKRGRIESWPICKMKQLISGCRGCASYSTMAICWS